MLPRLWPFFLLILASCGAEGNGNLDIADSDSIVEYDVNEKRISAVEFNNEMTLMQEDLLNAINHLFLSDSGNVEMNLENTLFEIDINMSILEEMKFDGSEEEFIAEMNALLLFYQEELDTEFRKLVPTIQKSELSNADRNILNNYDMEFAKREKEVFEPVFLAQETFANSNRIRLEER